MLQARLSVDWPVWDTYASNGAFSQVLLQQMLSNLVRIKKDSISAIEGDTAESWDVSGDGTVYTFKIRKNVAWSDGKPFTSADAQYSLQRATNPRTKFNASRVEAVSKIEAPDSGTLRITLKNASASFLPNVATPFMLMYPAHAPDIAEWQKAPITSGAFLFSKRQAAVSVTLLKNANYYGRDKAGRTLPYLEGIEYQVMPDPTIAKSAFIAGRLHCGCGYDEDFLTQNKDLLEKDIPGVNLGLAYTGAHQLLFNLKREPFNNTAIRQAVAIGIDKQKIASIHRGGHNYAPAPPLYPPEVVGGQWGLPKDQIQKIPGYNPDHSVDVAIAKRKFQEAGVDPKNIRVELMFPNFFGPEGELITTTLSEIGVTAVARGVSSAEGVQSQIDGRFSAYLRTPGLSIDDPADQYVTVVISGGPENYGGYTNDRVTELLRAQDRELDPAKRRALLWEVQRIHLDEFPSVPLFYQGSVYGVRPEVANYLPPKTAVHAAMRLEELWLK